MTDAEREAERTKRKEAEGDRTKAEEDAEELRRLRALLGVAPDAPRGALVSAVIALGAPSSEDARATLAELAKSRAEERKIPFDQALTEVKNERKDLVEAVRPFYAPRI